MKYMTKEWYETMQRTDLHLPLDISKKAESFSEDYFRELYKSEEEKWLELQKEVSQVEFEDIFPEESGSGDADGSYLEDTEKAHLEQQERTRKYLDNLPAFDPDLERNNFKQMFCNNIDNLNQKLPQDILRKVADIRVLALDVASRKVKKEITKFCKRNEKIVRLVMNDYDKQYRRQFKSNPPPFASKLSLHDCTILSCQKEGNDIILTIDNSGGFTNIDLVRMKNCTVIKQDAPIDGAWYLYEEIYNVGKQYEIHFLLEKDGLIDFIVLTDNLEYQYDRTKDR